MKSNTKYIVLIAGVVFNLTVGVLYSWSVVKSALQADLGWTKTEATLPYTLAILFFAIGLLIGGRLQDRIGPRKIITIGGVLVGSGLIISSFLISNPSIVAVTFGVISGVGIGFGYGAVTPSCLKWFHPSKKGLISGVVAGAFGLGAVIFSPLTNFLLNSTNEVSTTFLYLGIGIMIVSVTASQFIRNPEPGYVAGNAKASKGKENVIQEVNYTWQEMMKTKQFYLVFLIFTFGSSVGLMIIGNMSQIFNTQVGTNAIISAAMMVSLLSVFNASGRVLAGVISDKIGRNNTLLITAFLQGIIMLFFPRIDSVPEIIVGCMIVGYSYGSYLSVIPALTADNFGLKNYGMNYGITYLAWGIAGVLAPMIAANIGIDKAYFVSAGFSGFVLILGLVQRNIKPLTDTTTKEVSVNKQTVEV